MRYRKCGLTLRFLRLSDGSLLPESLIYQFWESSTKRSLESQSASMESKRDGDAGNVEG